MSKFTEIFEDVTKQGTKIPTNLYLENGLYPIIDQGQSEIAGYTDQTEGLFTDIPAIIFGDHTRIIKYVDAPCFLGADGVKLLKAKDPTANYKYLYYALCNADIPNTGYNRHFKWLKEIEIAECSTEEQNSIVAQFEKIDTLICLRKQQLSKLDELVKSRFIEMFGDPKTNAKEWKMNTFADICSVRQGLQIPISKRLTQYEEGCYEYITVAYLHGSKEREYIKNPKNTVICTKDDILMTRTGNTGMVITDVAGVFHNNFFLIDFDRIRYNKVFLAEYLNLDLIQAEIRRRAGTSTIPDLNHGEFYAIAIYEPPIELQDQFASFVEQIDKSKFEIQQSLEKLETLKKALMQKYFG